MNGLEIDFGTVRTVLEPASWFVRSDRHDISDRAYLWGFARKRDAELAIEAMPSLNLTKRKLTYTAADARCLESCTTLLEAMIEFDRGAKDDATAAKNLVASLWAHVNRMRSQNGQAK